MQAITATTDQVADQELMALKALREKRQNGTATEQDEATAKDLSARYKQLLTWERTIQGTDTFFTNIQVPPEQLKRLSASSVQDGFVATR